MADKKISALTAASTPLAGTEVLPIVQSGSTVKVSAADITAGRAVSALSFASTAGASFATTSGNVGISTASPITKLSNTSTTWAGGTSTDGFAWRSTQNDWTAAILGTPAAGAGYGLRLHTLGTTTSDYPLAVSSGAGSGTFKFAVQGDGTTTFTGGNLIQGTAAKGVNFTANTPAAGMTSQLLNWYEEGTFTPGVAFGGGSTAITYGNQYGFYTRIGRTVYVNGFIALTNKGSSTGNATITGLPFTSANLTGNYAPGAITPYDISFSGQIFAAITTNATTATIYQSTTAGVRTNATNTNFANTSELFFSFTYIV